MSSARHANTKLNLPLEPGKVRSCGSSVLQYMEAKGLVALWHGPNLLEVFECLRYELHRTTVFARHVRNFAGSKKLLRDEISIAQR